MPGRHMLLAVNTTWEAMDESFFKTGGVMDGPVIGKNGQSLGKLHDLLINRRDGRIAYACVQLQSDSRGRRVAYVPWSQFRISADGEITLGISRESLVAFSHWKTGKKEENAC